MLKQFILLSALAVVALSQGTAADAWAYADGNGDGTLTDDEFTTYLNGVFWYFVANTRSTFPNAPTGDISVKDFGDRVATIITDGIAAGLPNPGETGAEVASDMDKDNSDDIDNEEYHDEWYNDWVFDWLKDPIKEEMKDGAPTITEALFLAYLDPAKVNLNFVDIWNALITV